MKLIINLFSNSTEAKLERQKNEIYSQIEAIGRYKRQVLNELESLDKEHKKLCYRLNVINIKLKKYEKDN